MVRFLCLLFLPVIASACSAAAPLNVASNFGFAEQIDGIRYGEDDRQKYDLYLPADLRRDTPVVLFFYGGSWENGNRADYRFVGDALAEAGIISAIADYRVYPQVTFPTFVEDAARAFAAVHKRFNPTRPIFVMGHSAGAHIAAMLALDPRYLRHEDLDHCKAVAGLIGLAGPYDFLPLPYPELEGVFPQEARLESQPVAFAAGRKPPSLLLHGTSDKAVEPVDTSILANRLRQSGNRTTMNFYDGVSHAEIVGALSPMLTRIAPTKADILEFVTDIRNDGYPGCD